MELTKRESLKSDVTESLNADTKAEASRDDVYKRLWGQWLRWIITVVSIAMFVVWFYTRGYLDWFDKPAKIIREVLIIKEDPTITEVTIVYPRSLPATGSSWLNTHESKYQK